MIKVDILMPYWGDVALFKLAVQSVLLQTESAWRLLIFDDCYPSEEPSNYIDRLNDPRIIYHRHDKNLGITRNFNFALAATKSEYFVMMGCDDVMLPNYIEKALLSITNADFYQPGVEIIDENGKLHKPLVDQVKGFLRYRRAGIYSGEKLASSLCTGNWLYFPSILWRTSTVKKYGFEDKYKIAEDVVLQLNIIKDGGTVSLSNDITFQYRRFAQSLSSKEKSKGGVRFNEEAEVYKMFTDIFNSIGWKRAAFFAKLRFTSRIHQLLSR